MGSAPSPDAIVDAAKHVVAFVVLATAPGTNGEPPRGRIRIVDVLRGDLPAEIVEATFPPANDASWYVLREGGDAALAAWRAQPRQGPALHAALIAVVYPQPDNSVAIEPRACWPDNDGRRARVVWGAGGAITIIATPAEDPDTFEAMSIDERRRRSGGWKRFPLRSGRLLDTFFMFATNTDLGVFGCESETSDGDTLETCMIDRTTLVDRLPVLERLVEIERDRTARALWEHGKGTGDLGRIVEALRTGAWPPSADPAEEAAAFAHHLLAYGRIAKGDRMGVCWEYRGEVCP